MRNKLRGANAPHLASKRLTDYGPTRSLAAAAGRTRLDFLGADRFRTFASMAALGQRLPRGLQNDPEAACVGDGQAAAGPEAVDQDVVGEAKKNFSARQTRACGQNLGGCGWIGYCNSTVIAATWTNAKKLRAVFS